MTLINFCLLEAPELSRQLFASEWWHAALNQAWKIHALEARLRDNA